jgi:hypothetical protein
MMRSRNARRAALSGVPSQRRHEVQLGRRRVHCTRLMRATEIRPGADADAARRLLRSDVDGGILFGTARQALTCLCVSHSTKIPGRMSAAHRGRCGRRPPSRSGSCGRDTRPQSGRAPLLGERGGDGGRFISRVPLLRCLRSPLARRRLRSPSRSRETEAPCRVAGGPAKFALGLGVGGAACLGADLDGCPAGDQARQPGRCVARWLGAQRVREHREKVAHRGGIVVDDVVDRRPGVLEASTAAAAPSSRCSQGKIPPPSPTIGNCRLRTGSIRASLAAP